MTNLPLPSAEQSRRSPFADEAGLPHFQIAQTVSGILVPVKRLNRFVELLTVVGECWVFQGPLTHNGYGSFGIGGRKGINIRAHRMAFELWCEEEIDPALMVLHTCDRRPCCRPKHLFQGTAKQNTADMMAKGRNKYITPDVRKVQPEHVEQFIALRNEGLTLEQIAEHTGHSRSSVHAYLKDHFNV